jgi:hypothetical protein
MAEVEQRTEKGSLPSPNCSSAASSSSGRPLEVPFGDVLLLPVLLLLESLCSGIPPSLAWTVRSCRSRRSRRTKVLRHFCSGCQRVFGGTWYCTGCCDLPGT